MALMKIIHFYEKSNRSGNLLHIETDGCIVNIRVGLTNDKGHKVTSIDIVPDKYIGEDWDLKGSTNNRVIERKKEK